jgi:hypothetical protein
LNSADDRPFLTDVTLVAATSVAVAATVDAIRASMKQLRFAEVLLLTDQQPERLDDGISWKAITPLRSRSDYSRFMLRELAPHIRTSHALCIQWDGFVLNGAAWEPSFLDFDYIGAPWPHFTDGQNVGNGGFSLRSRRLLDACVSLPLDGDTLEDVLISRKCRDQLEGQGIRFAPEVVAKRFSYERMRPVGQEFGFHGAFNLVRLLPATAANRLFQSLEAGMLARNERLELLRWAIARGRLRLAANMFLRLV